MWNQWSFWGISRVVDYTDLWALVSLPLAYWYENRPLNPIKLQVRPAFVAILSFFAFAATSPEPPEWQDFERPMTFVYQVDTTDLALLKECCQVITKRQKENPSSWLKSGNFPNIDEFEFVDSLIFIKTKGAFTRPQRPITADTIEEKKGKQNLIVMHLEQKNKIALASSYDIQPSCSQIFVQKISKTLNIDTTLFGKRQVLKFIHSLQQGEQTYFYESGSKRLTTQYQKGLESGLFLMKTSNLLRRKCIKRGFCSKQLGIKMAR